MKKLLAIIVLGLLLPCIAISKTINIENRVQLNVPDNFNYIKVDTPSEMLRPFLDSFGEDASYYYVGTNNSIEFANLVTTAPEGLLEPIMKKIETKNFKTEKSMMIFYSKEFQKLFKRHNYEGIITVFLSSENLEDVDDELFELANKVKDMNQNDLKKESLKFKKQLKDILEVGSEEGLKIKISKFKIEKNPINEPVLYLKVAYNVMNMNFSIETYGYINDKKVILVISECLGKCKSISQVKNMINFSKLPSTNLNSDVSSNIAEELNQLNKLYKSGTLTKEEFEKGKKKLLNQ